MDVIPAESFAGWGYVVVMFQTPSAEIPQKVKVPETTPAVWSR